MNNKQLTLIVFVILFIAHGFAFADEKKNSFDDLLNAIRQVETGGLKNNGEYTTGDAGMAKGPFQIHKVYWQDAVNFDKSIGGNYSDCNKLEYSKKIVRAYMTRYAKNAIKNGDWQTIARRHNGGLTGDKKQATLKYWEKVRKALKNV